MLPLSIVVPLVVILDNSGSILQAWRQRRLIVWADLLPLLPFSFVGIALAMPTKAWLGLHWRQRMHFSISPPTFRRIIGLLLLASGSMLIWRQA